MALTKDGCTDVPSRPLWLLTLSTLSLAFNVNYETLFFGVEVQLHPGEISTVDLARVALRSSPRKIGRQSIESVKMASSKVAPSFDGARKTFLIEKRVLTLSSLSAGCHLLSNPIGFGWWRLPRLKVSHHR